MEVCKDILPEFLKEDQKDFNHVFACKKISENHNNTIHLTTRYKPIDLFDCKVEEIKNIIQSNMEKTFKEKLIIWNL